VDFLVGCVLVTMALKLQRIPDAKLRWEATGWGQPSCALHPRDFSPVERTGS